MYMRLLLLCFGLMYLVLMPASCSCEASPGGPAAEALADGGANKESHATPELAPEASADTTPEAPSDMQPRELDKKSDCHSICGELVEPCAVYSPPDWEKCDRDCESRTEQQIRCALQAHEAPIDVSKKCQMLKSCLGL